MCSVNDGILNLHRSPQASIHQANTRSLRPTRELMTALARFTDVGMTAWKWCNWFSTFVPNLRHRDSKFFKWLQGEPWTHNVSKPWVWLCWPCLYCCWWFCGACGAADERTSAGGDSWAHGQRQDRTFTASG